MKHIKLPMPLKLALGAFFAGVVALICFRLAGYVGVFALGEVTLEKALNHEVIWQAALVLLIGKIIATSLCYGTGGCGGIFAPIVFFRCDGRSGGGGDSHAIRSAYAGRPGAARLESASRVRSARSCARPSPPSSS